MRPRTALLVPCALIATACSAHSTDTAGAATSTSPSAGTAHVVEYAADVKFSENGTVTWLEGELDTSGPAEPTVKPVDDKKHSARFASQVQFLTPMGCTEPFSEIKIDANGVGQTPCTWEAYLQVDHFAPQIWIAATGEIVKIADRYHP